MSNDTIHEDAGSLDNRSPTVNSGILHNTNGDFSYSLQSQVFSPLEFALLILMRQDLYDYYILHITTFDGYVKRAPGFVNKLARSGRNMSDKNKPIPHFNNEDEERSFWATHDSTEFIDWNKAEKNPTFPQLKPSTRPVSIRLPESLIAELKMLANKMDVPYQSLMKTILAEKVREELAPYNHPGTE